jgi:hypothetical protein
MKLRASIVVDLDVDDYIAAGETQRRFENLFEDVRGEYPSATLRISERRASSPRYRGAGRRPVAWPSGAMNAYEDIE